MKDNPRKSEFGARSQRRRVECDKPPERRLRPGLAAPHTSFDTVELAARGTSPKGPLTDVRGSVDSVTYRAARERHSPRAASTTGSQTEHSGVELFCGNPPLHARP